MRVFMTGSTGYIGSAVVKALVRKGHQVSGLVRTAEREAMLGALGGTPGRGDLKDPSTYRQAAAEHDVSVHIALFDYGPNGIQADRRATEALLEATQGVGAPRYMLYTSGVLVLGHTGDTPVDERASTAGAVPLVAWRPAHEQLVLAAATETFATAVIRPGFVYGGERGSPLATLRAPWIKGQRPTWGTGRTAWHWCIAMTSRNFTGSWLRSGLAGCSTAWTGQRRPSLSWPGPRAGQLGAAAPRGASRSRRRARRWGRSLTHSARTKSSPRARRLRSGGRLRTARSSKPRRKCSRNGSGRRAARKTAQHRTSKTIGNNRPFQSSRQASNRPDQTRPVHTQ